MGMSRLTIIAASAVMAISFSASANAVASEGQCIGQDGTIMDIQGVKHCFVPIIPEEFQGPEYADEIKGVVDCTGKVTKTSIGDFCLVALEAKPAAATSAASSQINEAIVSSADDAN